MHLLKTVSIACVRVCPVCSFCNLITSHTFRTNPIPPPPIHMRTSEPKTYFARAPSSRQPLPLNHSPLNHSHRVNAFQALVHQKARRRNTFAWTLRVGAGWSASRRTKALLSNGCKYSLCPGTALALAIFHLTGRDSPLHKSR